MRRLFAVAGVIAVATSCSNLPSRIDVPDFDPAAVAERAIAACDADADGTISKLELEQAPGLAAAAGTIDSNGDGNLEQAEIEARLEAWIERKQALFIIPIEVLRRGQPLAGARVRFLPEAFLGDSFRPAEGTTNQYGTTSIVHAPQDRPDPDFKQGVGVGMYRVEVSKIVDGEETIPSQYNTESRLGQEIAADAAGMGSMLRIHLSE